MVHTSRHIPSFFFEIDDVYCGQDFIMVKIAELAWPRWMVVWVHHHSMTHHSRYGRWMRRPKHPAWRATHRAASTHYQSTLDIAMLLVGVVPHGPSPEALASSIPAA